MSISHQEAIRNTVAINNLRVCLGHVANGSDTEVRISQDDTTRSFIVYVGNRRYWGDSIFDALQNAADDQD
jgi:hypothetical protein